MLHWFNIIHKVLIYRQLFYNYYTEKMIKTIYFVIKYFLS